MPLPQAIFPLFNAEPSITSQLSRYGIQPIPTPVTVDSDHYPCITFQSPSDFGENANDGRVGVNQIRIVFNCYATRWLTARCLARALAAFLDGFSGQLPDGTHMELTEQVNLVDGWEDGSRIYRTSVHWLAKYRA
jgi:hypothetical protein